MLNKDTIVFITDTKNTAMSNTLKTELSKDNSYVGIVVQEKMLENPVKHFLVDLIAPPDTSLRYRLTKMWIKHLPIKKKSGNKNSTYFETIKERKICNLCYRYTPCALVTNSVSALKGLIKAVKRVGMNTQIFVINDEFTLDVNLINNDVSHYFVDNINARNELLRAGIYADKIDVNPIPVNEAYFEEYDTAKAKEKFGFSTARKLTLISASLEGDNNFKEIIDLAAASENECDFAVACGKNRALYDYAESKHLTAFNESVDMPMLIAASDLVICRPTTVFLKQVAAQGKTVIAMYPLGARERANLDYLLTDNRIAEAKDLIELREQLTAFEEGSLCQVPDLTDRFSAVKIINKIKEIITTTK